MRPTINNIDLVYNGAPASFVIKTLVEVNSRQGGLVDDPHRHNYYTVIWSFTAKGRHVIDFKEYPIEPDHVFFVSPEQVHQIILDQHNNPEGLLILFTPEFLQKNSIREDFISNLKLFRNSDDTPPLPINEPLRSRLKHFGSEMLQLFDSENEMKYESIGAFLKLFLIECNGHCSLQPNIDVQSIEVGRSLVKRFKESVERNYKKWHQVMDYAGELSVTANYLNEVIKSNLDKSAKDYIQSRIIVETKRLIVFTDKSFKEIGYELGFDDPSHFSKFFKTQTGMSFQSFKETVTI
jgi:AraC family transcriptional regulator, transcriptional activator of pobA